MPYRDAPAASTATAPVSRTRRTRRALALATALVAVAYVASRARHPHPAAALTDAPLVLLSDARTFPLGTDDLPPATPLAPLLAADEPERLALLSPVSGATRLARNETLTLRFNRLMVPASAIDHEPAEPVVSFAPRVASTAHWSTRSELTVEFAAGAWDRSHAVQLVLARTLCSLAGEALATEVTDARTLVFDSTAHLASDRLPRRIVSGGAVRLAFDGPIAPSLVASQLFAYEPSGGHRPLAYDLTSAGHDAEGFALFDLRMHDRLEPGARIALAASPVLLAYGEDSPQVFQVELRPHARIEGFDCPAHVTSADSCTYPESPGHVIDIAETLRVYASNALAPINVDTVKVTPALPAMVAAVEGAELSVRGDWAPGQVYEVRIGALRDVDGASLARTAPLAVRSAGRAPEVRSPSGTLVFEHDDRSAIRLAGIHVDRGTVRTVPVPRGDELRAALALTGPATNALSATATTTSPLADLLPGARANRWARGSYAWRNALALHGSPDDLALVSFTANDALTASRPALVQATDLAVTARALRTGVLAWITSLATALPVSGATVSLVRDRDTSPVDAVTDASGLAFLPLANAANGGTLAIRATHGAMRAVMLLDPRTAIGPDAFTLDATEAASSSDASVASVLTDRGAYRPGDRVRARVVVRTVHGDVLRAVTRGTIRVRRRGGEDAEGAAGDGREVVTRLSSFGTAAVEFVIDRHAPPGPQRIEVYRPAARASTNASGASLGELIGSTEITVAAFREPTMRVDVGAVGEALAEGDTLASDVRATYLFGSSSAGAHLTWSLRRDGVAPMPVRWSQYAFGVADSTPRAGTTDSGETDLDEHGAARITSTVALGVAVRQRATLDVQVRDASGQGTAARTSFTVYPGDVEAGVHTGPDWVAQGTALDVDAVVIAHDGTPASARTVDARIVREGWHGYMEWSDHARDDAAGTAGGYQPRRTHTQEQLARCTIATGANGEGIHCPFTPTRPGTYLLVASTRDARGRESVASRRVYVAGPDEHPDRDPPGAPIALTPSRTNWLVGETARVAVESPWTDAEALLTVEREGVLHTERRRLAAGASVFEIPVTPAMVPNAFVSLVLARPRTGTAHGDVDFDAPDLRLGITELSVRPAASPLTVDLALAAAALPGTDVPLEVTVHDPAGHGARAEVVLYAVDEGTLRFTNYTSSDPTTALYTRHAPVFAMEDLRRSLVSRVAQPELPSAGGDGDARTSPDALHDERERFEPTVLWLPHVVTDASGRARTVIHVPSRATQYRVMAVAIDTGARTGRAEVALVATRPVVVRTVVPRSVVAGDRFEAAALVHNTTALPVDATVTVQVGSERRAAHAVHLAAGGDVRIGEWIDVPRDSDVRALAVRFEALASGGSASTDVVSTAVIVRPRARAARSTLVTGVQGERTLDLALGDRAETTLTVATHPFLALDTAADTLEDEGGEPVAALSSLAALVTLQRALPHTPGTASLATLRDRAATVIEQVLALQSTDGGFVIDASDENPSRTASARALHALVAASRAGFDVPAEALARARAYVTRIVHDGAGYYGGDGSRDTLALELRTLRETGAVDGAQVTAMYEQRGALGPNALAQLAMAMEGHDRRRDDVLAAAVRLARDARASVSDLAAVLEAVTPVDPVRYGARELASRILAQRAGDGGSAWTNATVTACALEGLVAYAQHFRTTGAVLDPHVRVDGVTLAPVTRTTDALQYRLPPAAHRLTVESRGRPAFVALDARWTIPVGPSDDVARGRDVALHRVFETARGMSLANGAHVKLGDIVRVRLFVCGEENSPQLALHDPLGGGFDAVDAALDTSPLASLDALLGTGPDDAVIDPRGFYARRSAELVAHRAFGADTVTYVLSPLTAGLHEFTFAVRASAVGTFALLPADLEAADAPHVRARSTVATLTVDP